MYLYSASKKIRLILSLIIFFGAGCTRDAVKIDLVNNEAQKWQAFNQILNNPKLQKELLFELRNDSLAFKNMMQDHDFTRKFLSKENMNYLWDINPGIDTFIIDNVTTRMHTDTNFYNAFEYKMERGTPSNTP